jgi:hypothetical protein
MGQERPNGSGVFDEARAIRAIQDLLTRALSAIGAILHPVPRKP